MNLKLIWINILNPVFIKNEIKRKKIQIIICYIIINLLIQKTLHHS